MDVGQFDERGFLRRRNAAEYLLKKYGFGAERTLAKGVVTEDTPEFRKAGRIVLYTREALDKWALAKIGPAAQSSSDKGIGGRPRKVAQPVAAEDSKLGPPVNSTSDERQKKTAPEVVAAQ